MLPQSKIENFFRIQRWWIRILVYNIKETLLCEETIRPQWCFLYSEGWLYYKGVCKSEVVAVLLENTEIGALWQQYSKKYCNGQRHSKMRFEKQLFCSVVLSFEENLWFFTRLRGVTCLFLARTLKRVAQIERSYYENFESSFQMLISIQYNKILLYQLIFDGTKKSFSLEILLQHPKRP